MQKLLLFAPLAAGVLGIPSGNQRQSDTKASRTTDKASSVAKGEAAASPTQLIFEIGEVCRMGSMDQDNWNKFGVDNQTGYIWDQYPNDIWHDHDIADDASYVTFLMNILNLSGKCEAASSECNLVSDFDYSSCEPYKIDSWTPMFYFILSALENFHDWQYRMHDEIIHAGTSIQADATKIVTSFSHDQVSDSETTNNLAISSAVLTMLAGMLAACPECSAVATIAGGATTMGSGLLGAAEDSAIEILQKEFYDIGDLEHTLKQSTEALAKVVRSVGASVLGTSITDMGKDYYNYPNSAPSVLQNGAFAAPFPTKRWEAFTDKIDQAFAASAINTVWGYDQVFIAKGTRQVNGENLASFKIHGQNLINDARVCDDGDDGDGTCYFFIMAQSRDNAAKYVGDGPGLKYPMGLDKLDEFGLDLLQFAKSADWYQNTFGAYLQNATVSDMYDALQNVDTASYYFVNMPVVSFDNAPTGSTQEDLVKAHYTTEDYFIEDLMRYVSTLDYWPYHKMW